MEATFLKGVKKVTTVNKINSAIFFGEYGTGKTWLAASADDIADYSPVLIVDIEGSAAGVGRKYPNVDIITADTYAKLELIKKELLTTEHPYKTVIFDTLNVAQNRAEKFFKTKPENANNKFGVWSDLKDWTLQFVRDMHHADFMAIFIAHSQVDKDDNTGKVTTTVKLSGSSRQDVPTVPDMIGYVGFEPDDEGKPVRVLTVGRHNSIVTKNRFGIDEKIVNPTIFEIEKHIITAQQEEKK